MTRPPVETRFVLVLLLSVATVHFGLEVLSYLAPGYGEDLAKHWIAPRVLHHGENPYDPEATRHLAGSLGAIENDRTYFHYLERFHYPPLNLLLFSPLSYLPLRGATTTFILVSAALYLLSLPMLLQVLRFEAWSAQAGAFVAAMLFFGPALGAMSLGQVDVAVFFALVLGLWLEARSRPVAAGLAIALAIHIKLFPVVFVVFYLLTRRRRMAMWIVAWTALLGALCVGVVGWETCLAWLRAETAYAGLESGWEQYLPSNLSIPAFLMKGAAFLKGDRSGTGAAIVAGRVVMVGLISAAVYATIRAARRGGDACMWALGAFCAATSMSSAMTFQHHLVWLAIPLGLALRESWDAGDPRRMASSFLVPYLLIATLDPWNQPLRDLTADLPKVWRDVVWSVFPIAITAGTLAIGFHALRRAMGTSPPTSLS